MPHLESHTRNPPANDHITRWTVYHSGLLIAATLLSVATTTSWIALFAAAGSFLVLVFSRWKRWTDGGHFGLANLVTLLRLGGVLLFAILPEDNPALFVTTFGFVLLTADGIDGWVAKRLNQTSHFGEYFDKETDAFFLLVICLMAVLRDIVGMWILAAGLLRYILVLSRHWLSPVDRQDRKSGLARVIYVAAVGALLICFLPVRPLQVPLAALATVLLIYSFAGDFRELFPTTD